MKTIIYKNDPNSGPEAIGYNNPLPVVGGYDTDKSYSTTTTSPDARVAQQIKAATSDQSIYITDLVISTSAAKWVQIEDGDGTVLMYPMYLAADTTKPISFSTPLQVTESKALNFKASVSGVVTVTTTGYVS